MALPSSTPLLRLAYRIGQVTLTGILLVGCDRPSKPEGSVEVAARSALSGALSTDGAWAVVGSGHHGGSLWQLPSGERVYDWNHKQDVFSSITSASFSPDDTHVLTVAEQTLVLWDRKSGEAEQYWSSPTEVLTSRLGPGGERALLGLADHRASVYNVGRGGVVRNLHHSDRVSSVDLSADGQLGLSGSGAGTATLWDLTSGQPVAYQQHQSAVQLVRLSPRGERLLSVARYERARIWSPEGEVIWELPVTEERVRRGTQVTSARFSEDGAYLLTGQPNGLIQLWDVDGQRKLHAWRLPKRKAWHPTAAAALDVSFTETPNRYRVLSSDGFVHDLVH